MSVVYPTNTCFDDALDYINIKVLEGDYKNIILVHAICLIPKGQLDEGIPYAHGWIEENNLMICAGIIEGHKIYYSSDIKEHKDQLRVQYERRYTVGQALAENWQHNYYGPWDSEIIKYVRRGRLTPRTRVIPMNENPTLES